MGRVVLRAEGDVFPTAALIELAEIVMSTSPVLDDVELLAGDDRDGIDTVWRRRRRRCARRSRWRDRPRSPRSRRCRVAGGEPERVLVDADAQAAALADLVERAPSGAASSGAEALRRELLLDAPALARRRRRGRRRGRSAGSATVGSVTGSGRASRTSAMSDRVGSEHGSERSPGGGRRTGQRASAELPQPRLQPDDDGDSGRDRGQDDQDGKHDREVTRPVGVVGQCRRRALDQLVQLRIHCLSGRRLAIHGNVDGAR